MIGSPVVAWGDELMRIILTSGIFVLAGVAGAASAQPPAEGLDVERCVLTQRGALILGRSLPERVAAGETVAIAPQWTPFPSWFEAVPTRCITNWRVSDRRIATLSADRSSLRIAANAAPGAVVTITARYRNRELRHQFTVIQRVASPLVGRWRPVAGACAPNTAITGLVIRDDGGFEVETIMRPHYSPSASGNWRVDGDRLLLTDYQATDDNGNPSPDFQPEARFTLEGDVLRFDRPWHGSVAGRGTCNAPLERAR